MPIARTVSRTLLTFAAAAAVALLAAPASAAPPAREKAGTTEGKVERGRYLVKIAGCNDCHTAGYLAAEGKLPESAWLTGDTLGWRGSWGTTYPSNLRLTASKLSQKEWVEAVRALRTRPPMPWFGLREMRAADLTAIYQFIKQLGPVGAAPPAFVPAGTEPKTPFVAYPSAAKK